MPVARHHFYYSRQEAARSRQQEMSASKCPVGASFACDFNAFNAFNFFPCALRPVPYAFPLT